MIALLAGFILIFAASVAVRAYLPKPQSKFSGKTSLYGYVTNVQVLRPLYKDAKKVGTKILFELNICNLGLWDTKITAAMVGVDFGAPINEKIKKDLIMDQNHVHGTGLWDSSKHCVYFDDYPNESCKPETLEICLIDTTGSIHTIK